MRRTHSHHHATSPDDPAFVRCGAFYSWDSISPEVILAIGSQLVMHEDHTVVTTGHSMGGSLALLAAIALQQNIKNA